MTKVRFIGDVHGKYDGYKAAIKNVPFSIQVGDMGVGFRTIRYGEEVWARNPPFDRMSKGRHLFIRGNHDNPEVCRRHKYWIPDGTAVDGIFCLGGAVSIDRAYRTEGRDWWSDEECTTAELQDCVSRYVEMKPEIVCTHECPESIAGEIMAAVNKTKVADGSRTRQALETMLDHHQPRYWVFGHWHESMIFQRGRTTFQCLTELEFVDVDVADTGSEVHAI
ncbi:metallophosphoesterase [Phyllobacterium sp. SYP-B3895]|uniref:metallophosphoesterase family protein n=1 Tax=Phyllobacterium sp. SYP-B3895 TaxID=2663240 RepID=UPI001561F00F